VYNRGVGGPLMTCVVSCSRTSRGCSSRAICSTSHQGEAASDSNVLSISLRLRTVITVSLFCPMARLGAAYKSQTVSSQVCDSTRHPCLTPPSPRYRIPHDGVSLDGGCMTFSIGFRAPSQRDLATAAAAYAYQFLIPERCVVTSC
jgi:hypothetical protein